MSEKKYRLVTRSDMDGLVCGTLLKYLDIIDEITFVHPKDMQDGKIVVTASRQQAEQALINLGAQTYIRTFYKADQQVGSQKVFVNN